MLFHFIGRMGTRRDRREGRGKGRCGAGDGCIRREKAFPRPPRRPPMPRPAPAHKAFADRNSLYQQITDKIVAELEQGRVPWVQPWANTAAPLGLPKNAASGRAYSGVNILILWSAVAERGFTTQRW